ncbi:MAG: hypothetical protein AABW82_04800 [Nanoarchaeota archaeon]
MLNKKPKNKEKKDNFNKQEAEQYYHNLIYSVLAVGGLTLPLIIITEYNDSDYLLIYGYLVLFISTLLIESFSQKMLICRNSDFGKEIKERLNYASCRWLIEIFILSPIFIYYIVLSFNNILILKLFLILYVLAILNWRMRPEELKYL